MALTVLQAVRVVVLALAVQMPVGGVVYVEPEQIHLSYGGDFAYDMDSDNARVGDEFMRQIEPVAAYVPYMTCVGNHENSYNFSNYVNRFSMVDKSGNINNHFFSFDLGPAHIISLSTEFYFFVEYGYAQIANQYHWLEEDLKEATKPENRAKRPWVITMGHRPMYCSNEGRNDCSFKDSIVSITEY